MESSNFYESIFDLNKLTATDRLLFYELRDERSWEEWTVNQKKRKIEQFAKIVLKLFTEEKTDGEQLLAEFLKLKMREINWVKSLLRSAATRANELQTELDQSKFEQTTSEFEINIDGKALAELLKKTIKINKTA